MNDRKTYKVNPSKVKTNDLMALVYYVKVEKVVSQDELQVSSLDDPSLQRIDVKGKELIANSYSADQYEEEEKLSKTQVAQILVNTINRPFTVCFEKADGTPRTLRGRMIHPEPLLGRSKVEDLDVKDTNKIRLVDHRTLKWLVVDGVKHTVK